MTTVGVPMAAVVLAALAAAVCVGLIAWAVRDSRRSCPKCSHRHHEGLRCMAAVNGEASSMTHFCDCLGVMKANA